MGVGASQEESYPKPSPSNPSRVPAPGPGLELGKVRLVVGSGTPDPAAPTPPSRYLLGSVGGSLEMDLGRRCGVDAGQTWGGSQRNKGVTGEAADTFLEKQAPSPLTFLPRISEQVSQTARAAGARYLPPTPAKTKTKARSPRSALGRARCGSQQRVRLGRAARGAGAAGSAGGGGRGRGCQTFPELEELPAPAGAGAAAAAAQVRGNTAP